MSNVLGSTVSVDETFNTSGIKQRDAFFWNTLRISQTRRCAAYALARGCIGYSFTLGLTKSKAFFMLSTDAFALLVTLL